MRIHFLLAAISIIFPGLLIGQNDIGNIRHNAFYTIKIKGALAGKRYIASNSKGGVGMYEAGTDLHSVWLVQTSNKATITTWSKEAGRGTRTMGPLVYFSMAYADMSSTSDRVYLGGEIISGNITGGIHRNPSPHAGYGWNVVDNDDGSYLLQVVPFEYEAGPRKMFDEGYLKYDIESAKFSYVSRPSEATSWMLVEVSRDELTRREKHYREHYKIQ